MGGNTIGSSDQIGVVEKSFFCTPDTPYDKKMKGIDVVYHTMLDMEWNNKTESMEFFCKVCGNKINKMKFNT